MEMFIQTVIFLLAVFGIIFTCMSFFDFLNGNIVYTNRENEEKITSENRNKNKVEIIVRIKNLSCEEEKNIIESIKNGKYNNIDEIADILKIEKY